MDQREAGALRLRWSRAVQTPAKRLCFMFASYRCNDPRARPQSTQLLSRSRGARYGLRALLSACLLGPSTWGYANVSVSESGVASASVPIAVPPGIAGMEPKLGFLYSGGGINGPLGQGWSVQGLSMITRCPANFATDGKRGGVLYQAADKLCLDGQRLIPTNEAGTPQAIAPGDASGVTGGPTYWEYRTEKDTFARIRAYGIANGSAVNGPAFFKVWTKNGQIYEYGNTADSRIEAQGKQLVMTWAANRISDTVGNFMDFRYEEREIAWGSGPGTGVTPGKEWNITSIRYTGRTTPTAVTPANRVDFIYADRTFGQAETYHQGSKNVNVRLLTEVQTFTNQQAAAASQIPVKVYKLSYEPNPAPVTKRNRLARIQDCSGRNPNVCMPAYEFSYSSGGDEAYIEAPGFNLTGLWMQDKKDGRYGFVAADFDGDGRTDILRWSQNAAENQLWFSRPTFGGGGSVQASFVQAAAFNITDQLLFDRDRCYTSFVADFNGDGRADILRYGNPVRYDGFNVCPGAISYLYISDGNGQFSRYSLAALGLERRNSKQTTAQGAPECLLSKGANFYLGDFNGDGRTDVVTAEIPQVNEDSACTQSIRDLQQNCSLTTRCNRLFASNGDGTFTEQSSLIPPKPSLYISTAEEKYRNFTQLDVNDDGISDFLTRAGAVFVSDGSGSFSVLPQTQLPPACTTSSTFDFNGDRRNDCLNPSASVGANPVVGLGASSGIGSALASFNLGNEFFIRFVSSPTYLRQTAGVVETDVNGDGKTDILRWSNSAPENRVWLSNGDGGFTQSASFSSWAQTYQLKQSQYVPNSCSTQSACDAELAAFRASGNWDFVLGDFTGRGHTEILRIGEQNTAEGGTANSNRLLIKANPEVPDQLVQYKSPSGAITRVSYEWLTTTGSTAVYARDTGADAAVYPRIDLQPAYPVVASLSTDTGVGNTAGANTTTQRYFYRGMKGAYDGRGQLGFRQVQREFQGPSGDWLTASTTYSQLWPTIGLTNLVTTRRGQIAGSGTELSRTAYTYCDRAAAIAGCPETTAPANALIRRPYVRQSVETGNDLNGTALPSVTTLNTYSNDWGDPDSISVTTTGLVGGQSRNYTKTTANTYSSPITASESWILGRLTRAQATSTVPDLLLGASAGSATNATATQGQLLTSSAINLSVASIDTTGPNPSTVSGSVTVSGGPVTVSVAGGIAPYTFAWARTGGSTARISANLLGSPSGSQASFTASMTWGEVLTEQFTVTVTDKLGTQASKSMGVTLRVNAIGTAPSVSVSPSPVSASRSDPGTVNASTTASATGSNGPFTYSWVRTGGSTNVISVINASSATPTLTANLGWGASASETFQVTVTDTLSRTAAASVTVNFSVPVAPPSVSISPNPVSASRNNPGVISVGATANVSSGQAPLSYSWVRTGGSTAVVTAANANTATPTFSASVGWSAAVSETFQVTVTDALGRSASASTTVSFTTPVALVCSGPGTVYANRSGAGALSGSATITPSGGTGGYSYNWSRVTGSQISVASPSSMNTVFSASLPASSNIAEVFRGTITDSAGNTASCDVTVNFVATAQLVLSLPSSTLSADRYLNYPTVSGIVSATTTATVSGGSGSFSMSWALMSGSTVIGVTPSPSSVSPQAFTFSATVTRDTFRTGLFRLTVTDSLGGQQSADLNVTLRAWCQGASCP